MDRTISTLISDISIVITALSAIRTTASSHVWLPSTYNMADVTKELFLTSKVLEVQNTGSQRPRTEINI